MLAAVTGAMDINWTNITNNFMQWSMQGYILAFGFFFWPFIFTVITGLVYVKHRSLVEAAVVLLILLCVFGNALIGVEIWTTIMYIIVALIFTGLFLQLLSKRR